MNHVPLVASLAALALLAGCAPVVYQKADIDGRVICDSDRMERVERDATRKFASVVWLNCPQVTLRVI
jgi:hypothetical protein